MIEVTKIRNLGPDKFIIKSKSLPLFTGFWELEGDLINYLLLENELFWSPLSTFIYLG